MQVLALALAVELAGCGARTGLHAPGDEVDGLPDAAVGRDAGTDAAPGLDASVDLLGCDGRPLPRPDAVTEVAIPPRMHALGVAIPDPLGLLLVGGLTAAGGPEAEQMVFLDLAAGVTQELPVQGEDVYLPGREAAAVYVPDGDQVVVIGGSQQDGSSIDQVFAFQGQGDPSGNRFVVTRALAPYPGGRVREVLAIWDPVGHRVIATGGVSRDIGSAIERATHALRDVDSDEPVWEQIVAIDDGPPEGARAMGYDPVRHRAIEITEDEDGEGLAVYALSLEAGAEQWQRIADIDFTPSTRGELVWDATSCGFHLLSARRTRCALEHWFLAVDDAGATAVYRGEPDLSPSHFLATATFVPARDRIVVYGSKDCESPRTPNLAAHEVAFVR